MYGLVQLHIDAQVAQVSCRSAIAIVAECIRRRIGLRDQHGWLGQLQGREETHLQAIHQLPIHLLQLRSASQLACCRKQSANNNNNNNGKQRNCYCRSVHSTKVLDIVVLFGGRPEPKRTERQAASFHHLAHSQRSRQQCQLNSGAYFRILFCLFFYLYRLSLLVVCAKKYSKIVKRALSSASSSTHMFSSSSLSRFQHIDKTVVCKAYWQQQKQITIG